MVRSRLRSVDILFQSTHPVRGATVQRCHGGVQGGISIHAPREGCDVLFRFAS